MKNIILGAGLGGLSSAYYCLRTLPQFLPLVLESNNRAGGWIKTLKVKDDITFESGPRTIRPYGRTGINTLEVVENLGLQNDVVPVPSTAPAAKNRMIYANGKLHLLPTSFRSLFQKQELFSKPLYRLLLNDFTAPAKKETDESIYSFTERRFGKELADYIISPLICGICAGDAKEISVNFIMKTLFQYEQEHGSIYKGIIKNVLKNRENYVTEQTLPKKALKERWSVYSFKNGLETLTEALYKYITVNGVEVKLNSACSRIDFDNNSITLHLPNNEKISGDHLISSIPAAALGNLVQHQYPDLASLLKKIKSVNVGVINLHYKENVIPSPGFGLLTAPKEEIPILGVIFDSCCFPKGPNSVLTVMMGGHWFEKYFGKSPSEETLLNTASEQLHNMLGITVEPTQYKVNILKNCIPQYIVGHEENLQNILQYIKKHKLPLSLCGASYYGVGVNDVIWSAKETVGNLGKMNTKKI